mgnify:CR=1 FL=1
MASLTPANSRAFAVALPAVADAADRVAGDLRPDDGAQYDQVIEVDLDAIPLDDAKTFELLASGETTGVFQLESAGMRRYIRELRPSSVYDLAAMVALFRPGTRWQELLQCSADLEAVGIVPGTPLKEAQARYPDARYLPCDDETLAAIGDGHEVACHLAERSIAERDRLVAELAAPNATAKTP